jgi:hypothetical protein
MAINAGYANATIAMGFKPIAIKNANDNFKRYFRY